MMLHIPEVLTPEEVHCLLHTLAETPWVDGRVSTGEQGAKVKNNRQLDMQSAGYKKAQAVVGAALQRNPLFFAAALPARLSNPLFNSYRNAQFYGFHVDGAMRQNDASGWMRTDLSATLFLVDPGGYEGGELVVNDSYGQHSVKLPAGDMILYPASSLHCVTPVTKGHRVASFLWVQSMVRDDRKRTQLFELDQNIQKLRTAFGEQDEILSLLNLYHNLLREWAEV
ncbi:Fe2+-dependent dioxygenase [Serratia ficaria]|uniref:PKHD-type hydroxylase Sbal_3634 n=1 Tax=Serratia ficaria TaxID=61651 RepID=A0A240C6R2_SERFI|nr:MULTISPECIES: Fe2+-dependent dioxygenase [Serratia]MEE4481533.1 Fe2+-dependent dioxygenase [Serratia ficaria]REF44010.1 PKHD-type hydroxylase [Serratia ficaria]CAI0728673.1 PKHD-type hydroxylase Sbal_3634 [Serratia ficaria]CAI0731919.1 PKHD-type hydroxylase Sbal_3634 [Serratia ficaria]CAI0749223.1 PKHD-type hydroxylase Sbal_3634 [Serratia ficaria]